MPVVKFPPACRIPSIVLGILWLAVPILRAEDHWFEPAVQALSPTYRQLSQRAQGLQKELATLPPTPVSQQSERVGWHSRFAPNPNVTKWLQIDLGRVQPFDAVVLAPVDVAYGTHAGPGYGFPLRFRVETSDEAAFFEPRLITAFDDTDFPNPGNSPVFLASPGAVGRFVRITATRLWPRDDLALFAIGEVFVLRTGLDIAAGAAVTASDTYNNAPMWDASNATDGQSALGAPVQIAPAPGNGWHAQIATVSDVVKWVQVDLGDELPLDEVRLYPARPKDFPARRGFGFPLRFRVEVANDAEFAGPIVLLDETQADFVNPAENPVIIPGHEVRARYLRVTATRLWERSKDFIFALAELEAYSGGKNVALGAVVTSSDSIESGTWSRHFLVDGFNSQGRILDLAAWLRALSRRREIEQELGRLDGVRTRASAALAVRLAAWSAGVVLAIAAVCGWWLRRRARARRREVEELRQRIASDLHDEIGSNLASIALMSQMALRQSGEAQADLAEINRVARETASSMRDIVWLIKPGVSGAGDFVGKLRETAASLLTGLEWQFDGSSLTRPLSLEWKRDVLLIFKEALHNIRRHAGARKVTIRLADTDGEFLMQITDDGAGFTTTTPSTGYGLTSQHQRARALGGEFEIQTAPGQGTTVALRVKLPSFSPTNHG